MKLIPPCRNYEITSDPFPWIWKDKTNILELHIIQTCIFGVTSSLMSPLPLRFKLLHFSGSDRVLGCTVYRDFLNRVYGTFALKYEYSVHCSNE